MAKKSLQENLQSMSSSDVVGGNSGGASGGSGINSDFNPEETVQTVEETEQLDSNNQEETTEQNQTQEESSDNNEQNQEQNEEEQNQESSESNEENEEEGSGGNEEESGSEESEDTSVVESVAEQIKNDFGIEFSEDELQDISDDEKGVKELTKRSANKLTQTAVKNFFNQDSDLAAYYDYVIENGGSPEEFKKTFWDNQSSWESVEFNEEDTAQHEKIVREKLSADGHDKETIDEMVSNYKDSGILDKQAKSDVNILKKRDKEKKQQELQRVEEEKKQQEQQQEQFKQEVQQILEKGEINGFKVPEKDRSAFQSYLFEPIDENGTTQYQKDLQSTDTETQLSIPYLMYKGFDISKEVDKNAKSKKAGDLKQKLSKASQKKKVNDNKQSSETGVNNLKQMSTEDLYK